MIDDVDRTVEALLRHALPRSVIDQVALSFAAPDNEFPHSSVSLPAIDLFLYDLRENRDLRTTQWEIERQPDGTTTRQQPPARVDCSYLITAWPSSSSPTPPLDEHHLLGQVMQSLLRFPTIPANLLQGSLQGQTPPLPTATLQPGRLQSLAEFWQALGGKPKAALTYTVTIGVTASAPEVTAPIVTDTRVRLGPGVDRR